MTGLTFSDLARAVIVAILSTWRPCQPLLASAGLIALAIAAFVGLFTAGESAVGLAVLPMWLLTLIVSAGVAGFIVSRNPVFTEIGGVVREPRSFGFILRYILLNLILGMPMLIVVPALVPAEGGGAAGGAVLVALALLVAILWLAARLMPFPYSVFTERPLSLGEAFKVTEGHSLKIVGCILLFFSGILLAVVVVTGIADWFIGALAGATGLGGGAAAVLAVQSVAQIAAAYALDCVAGTITRLLVVNDRGLQATSSDEV